VVIVRGRVLFLATVFEVQCLNSNVIGGQCETSLQFGDWVVVEASKAFLNLFFKHGHVGKEGFVYLSRGLINSQPEIPNAVLENTASSLESDSLEQFLGSARVPGHSHKCPFQISKNGFCRRHLTVSHFGKVWRSPYLDTDIIPFQSLEPIRRFFLFWFYRLSRRTSISGRRRQ
jgi:hypothetical protein